MQPKYKYDCLFFGQSRRNCRYWHQVTIFIKPTRKNNAIRRSVVNLS